ncbi:MAG: hypothetical protein U0795_24395 [Pirellulales bacterium]
MTGLEINQAYLIEEGQPAELRTRKPFRLDDGEDKPAEAAALKTSDSQARTK